MTNTHWRNELRLPEPEEALPPAGGRWGLLARLWRRSRVLLPMNSDIEVSRTVVGVPVVIQIRPSDLGFAALGGALGSLARYGLVQVSPGWDGLSAGTAIVNILGPFLLGVLLQSLSTGQETPRRRTLRLFIGVGFLGALTSYAELALDIIQLGETGQWLLAAAYGTGTLVLGVAATWFGIFLAGRRLFLRRAAAAPATEVSAGEVER